MKYIYLFLLLFTFSATISAQDIAPSRTQHKSNVVDGSDMEADGEWGDPTDDDKFVTGDATGDKKVTKEDVDAVVSYILGNTPKTFDFKQADINRDGKITLHDLAIIIYIVKNRKD